jgi:hypothetical protein
VQFTALRGGFFCPFSRVLRCAANSRYTASVSEEVLKESTMRGKALKQFQRGAARQLNKLSGNTMRNSVNRQLVKLSGTSGMGGG